MSDRDTALDETPDNINMLSPLVWKFQIHRTPNLNFFVQNINLPGIHLPSTDVQNPFVKIPYPGDHLQYDNLMINFKIDENFTNWLEIYNWIKALGFPDNFGQHKTLTDDTVQLGHAVKSDITLIIMNSNRIPIFDINFIDAFPTTISSAIFDVTQETVKYIDASATFAYRSYTITAII